MPPAYRFVTLPAGFILTAISRDPALIRAADAAGVDRIGIDIERLGKLERQGRVPNARISEHRLDDLATVASNVVRADVFVRLNPIHEGSRAEVETAIALGARVIMLPYFSAAHEVALFVDLVAGRATTVLLLETAAAVARIGEIVIIRGVDEIMVGLNDLHISLDLASRFEVVVSDLMVTVAARVRDAGIRFGFGGLARVDDRTLPVPPDLVCSQYPRLGATSAWLARSFFHAIAGAGGIGAAIEALRRRLEYWADQPPSILAAKRGELLDVLRRLDNRSS